MKTNLEMQISEAKSLLDVLLILKQKTMLDTHVATLAYLRNNIRKFTDKYGIWECSPFPLDQGQDTYNIQAYYFSADGDNFNRDKMVLVVFTDRNFINSLQSVNTVPKETQDVNTHSIKYGVIVSLPGVSLTPSEKSEILKF